MSDSDSMNDDTQSFLDREANNNGSEREETSQAQQDGDGEQEDVLLEQGPQPNMEFDSKESLFNAYQSFGKMKGFCVAIRNYRDDKYIMICCDRGRKTEVKKHTKRVDCRARINAIKQDSGYWRVTKVQSAHNHDLDPTFSVFMAPHCSMSINTKRQLEKNDVSGLRPCQTIKFLQVEAGGSRNLGCTPKDCRNFIDERRRLRLGEGDAAAIHKLFLRLQQKDRNFFHLMDIDDRSRLRNVMWIHPRSRAAYEDFNDVVSFDTTYCLNRYEMPLATVVGVNHHHQSMLLGCGLLTHERADSFRWFFTNWLEAMGGVQPKAILTDQCESINIALREIMPNTVHRFCLWHIVSKIGQKFKGMKDFTTISSAFKFIIYNSLSIDDFESRWADFVVQYNMGENEWLKSLYEIRAKWVPAYLVEYFWAGMVSTQRSESMNAFFDHYITPKSTLKIFVEQYEISLSNKIEKELHAEYQSKCTYIKRRTAYEREEQFGSAYTNNVFNLLHGEIDKVMNCNLKQLYETSYDAANPVERYEICELGIIDNCFHKEFTYCVEYRPVGGYFLCDCRKFESKGIFCCHVLKLLIVKGIRLVDERYILRRWKREPYRPHMSIFFAGGYPHMTKEYKMFQEAEKVFVECTDLAYKKQKLMNFLKGRLDEIRKELLLFNDPEATTDDESEDSDDPGSEINLGNPKVTNRRGRPKKKRFKSAVEISQSRGKSSSSKGRGRGSGRGHGRGRVNIDGGQGDGGGVTATQGSVIQ